MIINASTLATLRTIRVTGIDAHRHRSYEIASLCLLEFYDILKKINYVVCR
jgi:hypothetical protein